MGLETITQATEAIWTTAFLVLRMRKQVLKAASQEGVYPQNQMSLTTKSTPVTGGPRQTQGRASGFFVARYEVPM